MSLSAAALGTLLTPEAATAVACWLANQGRQGSFASAAAGGGIALTLMKTITWTEFKVGRVGLVVPLAPHLGPESPAHRLPTSRHNLTLIEFRQSGFPPLFDPKIPALLEK